MNLSDRLRKIAIEKIQRTQIAKKINCVANTKKKPCVARSEKPHVAIESKETIETAEKLFFPKIPIGFFGYSKPFESRAKSETLKRFTEEFERKLKQKNNKNRRSAVKCLIRPALGGNKLRSKDIEFVNQNAYRRGSIGASEGVGGRAE